MVRFHKLDKMVASLLSLLLVILTHYAAAVPAPAPATSSSYPDFQLFQVSDIIASTKLTSHQQQPVSYDNDDDDASTDDDDENWKLRVVHRDHVNRSHNSQSHSVRFDARMLRDAVRVASLTRRLYSNSSSEWYSDLGADVISGMAEGSGEYFVRIGVGSPPRRQYMVIDTGSDVVWVQCQPCRVCYRQSDPVFDPALSASFSGVSCSSSVCSSPSCRLPSSACPYQVSYGDGSYTKGTLALETLTFSRAGVVRRLAIGCGHRNRGMFVGAAGLLGLGGGALSLVGQLAGQIGGAFSYCLVSRGAGASPGFLALGRGAATPVGAAWIPLLRNARAPSFYYVGLSGLGVGGARLPISQDHFTLTDSGYGGVVMDTGTAVTRIPAAPYVALRDAFLSQTPNLPRAPPVSIFDTCYDLMGFVSVRVPTVSFYFSPGPVLTLPARNFLIPVDDQGTFCFAFAPSPNGLSIIGNIQQEGIQISFDGANGFVGFGPQVC